MSNSKYNYGIVTANKLITPLGNKVIDANDGHSLIVWSYNGTNNSIIAGNGQIDVHDIHGGNLYVDNLSFIYGKNTKYAGISTSGFGLPAIVGLDARHGVTAPDTSPITLYTVPSGGGFFRLTIGTVSYSFVSGTGTYTLTFYPSIGKTTISLSESANGRSSQTNVFYLSGGESITIQLTGTFSGNFDLIAIVEQIA